MSYSKNAFKLPDKSRIEYQSTIKDVDEGTETLAAAAPLRGESVPVVK